MFRTSTQIASTYSINRSKTYVECDRRNEKFHGIRFRERGVPSKNRLREVVQIKHFILIARWRCIALFEWKSYLITLKEV